MRSFLKGPSSSPLVQFSSYSEDTNDTGDGGGTPVFALLSITVYGISLSGIFYASSTVFGVSKASNCNIWGFNFDLFISEKVF